MNDISNLSSSTFNRIKSLKLKEKHKNYKISSLVRNIPLEALQNFPINNSQWKYQPTKDSLNQTQYGRRSMVRHSANIHRHNHRLTKAGSNRVSPVRLQPMNLKDRGKWPKTLINESDELSDDVDSSMTNDFRINVQKDRVNQILNKYAPSSTPTSHEPDK